MIVKDEAHVIERCLDSVKDVFTEIVIHDTGSTDDTKDIIEKWIKQNGKHGYVDSAPWVDFGINRSNVLEASRYCADYTLMLDADEMLDGKLDIDGTMDTYQMQVKLGEISYRRNFLFNNKNEWRFEGIVHEFPVCGAADFTTGQISSKDAYIVSHHDGARSKTPDKYLKDAQLLDAIENPSPREVFYCAQSYRDAGKPMAAAARYRDRTHLDGWYQEKAYSYYMLGKLLGVEHYFLSAYELDPRRAEPLLALGKMYMDRKEWDTALIYLKEASYKKPHDDMLFREDDVYDWRADMECAVCLHYAGQYESALAANVHLLYRNLPPHVRTQVEKNLKFAEEAMNT